MFIGDRTIGTIVGALLGPQHYVALLGMLRNYDRPLENLYRYLSARGAYPYSCAVRTPLGPHHVRLYSHHDLLTMNEVFCREDYAADSNLQIAVDIGANIGISALYFLTRNADCRCYLFEPDPANIPKLCQTLSGYESRYVLTQGAVGDVSGEVEFGTERTGRYGGIGLSLDHSIRVHCEHINDVLERVLKRHPCIDLMKIDTEGMEVRTVSAIRPDLLARVRTIYIEAQPRSVLQPELCDQRQRGSVCRLRTRHLA